MVSVKIGPPELLYMNWLCIYGLVVYIWIGSVYIWSSGV